MSITGTNQRLKEKHLEMIQIQVNVPFESKFKFRFKLQLKLNSKTLEFGNALKTRKTCGYFEMGFLVFSVFFLYLSLSLFCVGEFNSVMELPHISTFLLIQRNFFCIRMSLHIQRHCQRALNAITTMLFIRWPIFKSFITHPMNLFIEWIQYVNIHNILFFLYFHSTKI